MKAFKFLFILLFSPAAWLAAQSPGQISLQQCLELAEDRFPQNKQKALLRQSFDLADANMAKAYLPTFKLSAQATIQSDVTSLPIELPGLEIPTVPKDQYKAMLDINQMVYDGGMVKAARQAKATQLVADQQAVEVNIFQIREKVGQVFFGVLMINENLEQLVVMEKEIGDRLKVVKAGIENGVLLPSNAQVLEAELIKVDQKRISLESGRKGLLAVLSQWTGKELTPATKLQAETSASVLSASLAMRPEQKLFRARQAQIDAGDAVIKAGRRPTVGLFAQGGYGRPGLNFLDTDFAPWAMAGIRAQWNIFDWGKSKNERQLLDLNKGLVDIQKETFEFTTNLQLLTLQEEINMLQSLMEKDRELIALRTKIKRTAAVKLELGTLTATEYLTELNAEQMAQLDLKRHEVELIQKRASYRIITNN